MVHLFYSIFYFRGTFINISAKHFGICWLFKCAWEKKRDVDLHPLSSDFRHSQKNQHYVCRWDENTKNNIVTELFLLNKCQCLNLREDK